MAGLASQNWVWSKRPPGDSRQQDPEALGLRMLLLLLQLVAKLLFWQAWMEARAPLTIAPAATRPRVRDILLGVFVCVIEKQKQVNGEREKRISLGLGGRTML